MGVDSLPGEQDYDPAERMWRRPTLEVHGIVGGFTGEGAKTVIPAEAQGEGEPAPAAGAQTRGCAAACCRKRVADALPARRHDDGARMSTAAHGVLVPLDNVYMRAAEQALEQEWGRAPVFEREGGSIPVGALFDSELHVPVIFMGTGLPDDNIHAPNEKYHSAHFYHLIRQAIRFLDILGNDPAVRARVPRAHANRAARTPRRAER